MTTKHSTRNKAKNKTKRSPYLFLPPRDASSQDKASEASGASGSGKPSGFTLVELLVAMCVSLLLLGGVVSLFGSLGESVNNSKSNSEMLQTMRHTARQLQSDLGNVSLVPDPAQTQTNPQGFFEYVEGPLNDTRPDLAAAAADPELPPSEFVDNQDAGYTEDKAPGVTQSIGLANAGGPQNNAAYNNNCRRAYSKYLHGYGQWQKTGLESGTYRVSITWPTGWTSAWTSKHESNIPVTITAGDNTESFTVDQTQEPNDLDEDGTGWKHLGEIDVTDGEILVQIGPCGQGYAGGKFVFADAIRIECLELTGGGAEDGPAKMSLVGDCDDVLHFTTKTDEGAYEVVWFLTPMTGTPQNADGTPTEQTRYRLHRYERKFWPEASLAEEKDCSLSLVKDERGAITSLNDAANRENRFAHEKRTKSDGSMMDGYPGDPTLHQPDGFADCFRPVPSNKYKEILNSIEYYSDLDVRTPGFDPEEPVTEETNNPNKDYPRITQTVILENVIAFDVQAYDPAAQIRASGNVPLSPDDPGYSSGNVIGHGTFVNLSAAGLDNKAIEQESPTFKTMDLDGDTVIDDPDQVFYYDSWSGGYKATYDHDQDGATPEIEIPESFEVGFDNLPHPDASDGIVETAEDLRAQPPYNNLLRAVQVEIRMQEPESGKVRSVKVRKFLGKR